MPQANRQVDQGCILARAEKEELFSMERRVVAVAVVGAALLRQKFAL